MAEVAHTIGGWQPGALVFLYPATQEQTRATSAEPPVGEPLTGAVADERGAAEFQDAPEGVALLAYGTRIEGLPGWVLTRALASQPAPEPLVGGRSITEPDPGAVPMHGQPFARTAVAAELSPGAKPQTPPEPSRVPEIVHGREYPAPPGWHSAEIVTRPVPPPQPPKRPSIHVGARGADLSRYR